MTDIYSHGDLEKIEQLHNEEIERLKARHAKDKAFIFWALNSVWFTLCVLVWFK